VVGTEILDDVVLVPAQLLPLGDTAVAERREVFELHAWLNARPAGGRVPYRVLLVRHEGHEIVGRLLLFRQSREHKVPGAAVGVAHLVEVVLLPLAGARIEGLGGAWDRGGA